jgi:peptidoglycan/xylan/chitin deacetylase (PgdA/CDA1 family)
LRVARELALEPVMWNVTGYDWNAPPAAVIEKKVMRQLRGPQRARLWPAGVEMRGGDVILLHDGGYRALGADRSQTVIATDNLIRRFKDQGYEFVAVEAAVSHQPSAVR